MNTIYIKDWRVEDDITYSDSVRRLDPTYQYDKTYDGFDAGSCKPVNHEKGGIAQLLVYSITLYFNNDGTVYGAGLLDVVGMGTEHLRYYIETSAYF